MKKLLYLVLFFCAGNAWAQTATDLNKIETYLNNIKTLEANFVQTASNGSVSEGKIYIAKPNKIRMEYAPPTSVEIVGNGDFVVFNDKELEQITNIDYEDIPATLILSDNVKIDNKNITVADFYQDEGTTSITLEYAKDKNIGPITLVFSNNPFELKQWKVVDPQSIEITLSLYEAQKDKALDEGLFKFKKERKKGGRRR